MNMQQEIVDAIKPIIEADGNYLEEVRVITAGKRKLVTVIIDSDSFLNLDQVAMVSRSISEVVENLKSLGDTPFTIEVTSPGVDRPLTLPRHWKKNIGKLVKMQMLDGVSIEGRIENANGNTTEIDGKIFKFSDIKKAMIQIEFKK